MDKPTRYRESVNNRIFILTTVEVETPMWLYLCSLAINDTSLRPVLRPQMDRPAAEIDVAVAIAGVRAVAHDNRVAIGRSIDGSLDGGEVRRRIVIDVPGCFRTDRPRAGTQNHSGKQREQNTF